MVLCPICRSDFKDRRGLYGHFRFVHGVVYKGGKLARMDTPTKVTNEEIEKINKEQELTEVFTEKEFQTRLDEQINEAKEEIKQLREEVKRLNKGVRDVRDKFPPAGSDSVTPVVPSTSQKAGEKSTQPVSRGEDIDADTAGSNGREEKGLLEEIRDNTFGGVFSGLRDVLPKPRRFFRRRGWK